LSWGGCCQFCEVGLGAGALGVQVGDAGADACPVGLDGGVCRVGGGLKLADQAAFGGLDAGQFGAQVRLLAGAGFGVLGGGGGELGGEEFGAVVAEGVLVEESGDGVHDDVLGEGDRSVVGGVGGPPWSAKGDLSVSPRPVLASSAAGSPGGW